MKTAQGKRLGDAIEQWVLITNQMRADKTHKQIAPQFEYNTYVRDFLKDNPKLGRAMVIDCWKIKKNLRGDNVYTKRDLERLISRSDYGE